MRQMQSAAHKLLFILGLCYALLFLCARFFAGSMIFFPHPSSYRDTKDIIKLRAADGVTISAIYIPNDSARFVLLYSHGNGEDIGDDLDLLKDLQRSGFSVFAYDYHGYGTSQGKPSEHAVYMDIDAAYASLVDSLQVPPDRIIAFGHSLGGAAAVDMAARKPLAGLIMESSFVTAFRVMTRIPVLPFDKFRNIDKIKHVKCPVLFIHGANDQTIPLWHSQALLKAANQPKRLVTIQNGDHNDLLQIAGSGYFQILNDFAASLSASDPTKQ
ncbi:MAG: alpha/beta hydrolase [Candidatus Edwardsbacteria bacterium]|nr:alpha/beta hydrolase [Candidatus Edwardsbacteria bacterium]